MDLSKIFSVCVLSSGSRANCIYIQGGQTKILIDCGLSARETEKRLRSMGIDAEEISAIVLTHEHNDHIAGVPTFAKRFSTSVFGNRGTIVGGKLNSNLSKSKLVEFNSGEQFAIGQTDQLVFEPFSIVHDAADPVGFIVRYAGSSLGVVTDLGQVTNLVRQNVSGLDALILESNHDYDLLNEAPYPWELKQRIRGRNGHLSNEDAGKLVEELGEEQDSRLKLIIAAHISERSNHPELAIEALSEGWIRGCAKAGKTNCAEVIAASAFLPTRMFILAQEEPELMVVNA